MGTISVSVPEDMRRFVDDRVAHSGFGTPSEYMRHLITENRKRVARQQLDGLLLEGLDSGNPSGVTLTAGYGPVRGGVVRGAGRRTCPA